MLKDSTHLPSRLKDLLARSKSRKVHLDLLYRFMLAGVCPLNSVTDPADVGEHYFVCLEESRSPAVR